jgi:predicted regulator of Ras-like GTPase activity (Roadblock/LC7/MglB family)
MAFTNTHANPLGFLLDNELGGLDGVVLAALVTSDGLLSSRTKNVSQETAEKLAAASTALRGTALALGEESQCGGVRQVLVEMDGGLCVVMGAGTNMLLLTLTGPDADIGTITHAMVQLAGRDGHEMTAAQRAAGEFGG